MNETKEHLLKISFLLFLQKNFKDVTMNEIVEKTGMSKGAFYHYFKSKEELFEEIINEYYLNEWVINYDKLNKDSLQLLPDAQTNAKTQTIFIQKLNNAYSGKPSIVFQWSETSSREFETMDDKKHSTIHGEASYSICETDGGRFKSSRKGDRTCKTIVFPFEVATGLSIENRAFNELSWEDIKKKRDVPYEKEASNKSWK